MANEMMNMNMGLFAALGPSMGIPVASPALGGVGVAPGTGPGFEDLLGLVSDLEIADTQGQGLDKALEEALNGKSDKGLRDLKLSANATAIEMAMMQAQGAPAATPTNNLVGRPADLAQQQSAIKLGETASAADMLAGIQDLEAKALVSLDQSQQKLQVQDLEAATQWAAALATGDIKSIKLEKGDDKAPKLAWADGNGPLDQLKGASSEDRSFESLKQAQSPNLLKVPANATLPSQAAKPIQEIEPNKSSKIESIKNDSAPKAVHSNASSREAVSLSSDSQKASTDSGSRDNKRDSKSGSEVLLDSFSAGAWASHTKPASLSTPVVTNAQGLGAVNDPRVSREAIGFVADKIDALKAQGGGSLKVQLNPGELGAVEIRVSTRAGQVQIELLAERPSTLNALNAQKGELLSKLEGKMGASLEVGALSGAGVTSRNFAHSSAANAPTQQVLELRGAKASEGRQAQELHANSQEASANRQTMGIDLQGSAHGAGSEHGIRTRESSMGFSDSSSRDMAGGREGSERQREQGQDREDRRGRAFHQWEEIFDRKSA